MAVEHAVHRTHGFHGLSAETLSFLEIVVLAPLAGVLVLWAIPNAFDIGWSCVGGLGAHARVRGVQDKMWNKDRRSTCSDARKTKIL